MQLQPVQKVMGIRLGKLAAFSTRLGRNRRQFFFSARHVPEGWFGDWETRNLDYPVFKLQGLSRDLGAVTVAVNDDMVIALTGWRNANLLAIKLGGEGDISNNPDYIKWTNQRGNSYTPSPVLADGILYLVTDNGMISAFDALCIGRHCLYLFFDLFR